jgi:hypothetical protein
LVLVAAIAAVAAACGGSGSEATPTPAPSATPTTPPTTGSDEPASRDLVDLARRLGGQADPQRTEALSPPNLGDQVAFDVIDFPSPEEPPGRREAIGILRAISDHAYFFVENGTGVSDGQVDVAVRTFEEDIWPAVTADFGGPPDPGVDGDPRIVIFHGDLGGGVGGYVSGEDAYPRSVVPHSNGREAIYMNLLIAPDSPGYGPTLAHELQHVTHQRADADEDGWVNEGLSETAAQLVGGTRSFGPYLNEPDTQLNTWTTFGSSAPHYETSSLFFTYLLEQTGAPGGAVADETADELEGIRDFLEGIGSPRTVEEIVSDWLVANELDSAEGPYGYRDIDVGPPEHTEVTGPQETDAGVSQFAADYLELEAEDFASPPTFTFDGAEDVPVIGAQTGATGAFWWSGRGDSIDSTLTRELDLTGVSTATLTFRTWYDIERWFDFGYVAASRDGGATWQALAGNHTTLDDPLEVAYGPAYNSMSGGGDAPIWVDERVDLTAYAGERILVRFELLNDDATNGEGWAIDDIAVPETGFLDDAETDIGAWHREGFRRVSEPLPQRFALRLIARDRSPQVEDIPLDVENRASVTLDGLGVEYEEAVIAIIALTDGTTQRAGYRFQVAVP